MAIQELKKENGWSIQKMCCFLGVCRAAYYKWLHRKPSDKQLSDEDLAEKIGALYWEQNGILGYRQMTIAINRRHGLHCNAKRIYRLMTILGLRSVCRRKRRYRNKKVSAECTAENVLDRKFKSDFQNEKWLTDVTELRMEQAGIRQSMSRAGHCIDNGPMEGFWGILKTEMYYLFQIETYEALEAAVCEYIDFYNNRRYQKRLGCMTPNEFIQQSTFNK